MKRVVDSAVVSILLFFLIYFCMLPLSAAPVRILTLQEPPASFTNERYKVDGYITDIVNQLQQRVGQRINIELVPEARAQAEVKQHPNMIMFGISRLPFREDEYRWVGKVLVKPWVAYSLKSRNLFTTNLDELGQLGSVGVVRGDIRQTWLENLGLQNLSLVTNHIQNIQMLMKRRIDALVYEPVGLKFAAETHGFDLTLLQALFVVNHSDVWIVMSKQTPDAVFTLWHEAFNAMAEDGSILKIALQWQEKLIQDMNIETQVIDGILNYQLPSSISISPVYP